MMVKKNIARTRSQTKTVYEKPEKMTISKVTKVHQGKSS